MSASAYQFRAFDSFRKEWVRGHLDHQRAADALDAARQAAVQVRAKVLGATDEDAARRAEEAVALAQRRLAEVARILARQFDRFCGLPEEEGSDRDSA